MTLLLIFPKGTSKSDVSTAQEFLNEKVTEGIKKPCPKTRRYFRCYPTHSFAWMSVNVTAVISANLHLWGECKLFSAFNCWCQHVALDLMCLYGKAGVKFSTFWAVVVTHTHGWKAKTSGLKDTSTETSQISSYLVPLQPPRAASSQGFAERDIGE